MKTIKRIAVTRARDGRPDLCGDGPCPAFMTTEEGDILVQGYTLSEEDKATLGLPENEDVVSIPQDMLEFLIAHYGER